MTSYSWLKGRLPTCIMLVVCLAFIPGSVLAADVDVYAEGAYTDSDLVVYIYADINAGPILSFGVKVNYPAGLTFDPSNSSQNKAEWYFGESSPGYDYMPPEDDGTGVVLIGGKLDTDAPIEGVEGSRKLLGILTFTHSGFPFGHPINDPAPISVELGRVSPYENFVGTGGALLDGSTGFTSVIIARRGRGAPCGWCNQ